MLPFDRFDAQGKAILAGAYHISRRFGQAEVDPEHYLLALLEQTDGMAARILKQLSVNDEVLGSQIEAVVSAKSKAQAQKVEQVFITPPAKRVLLRAIEEAARLEDAMILPEHLLLALLYEGSPTVTKTLIDQGVTYARVDEAIRAARNSASG